MLHKQPTYPLWCAREPTLWVVVCLFVGELGRRRQARVGSVNNLEFGDFGGVRRGLRVEEPFRSSSPPVSSRPWKGGVESGRKARDRGVDRVGF